MVVFGMCSRMKFVVFGKIVMFDWVDSVLISLVCLVCRVVVWVFSIFMCLSMN